MESWAAPPFPLDSLRGSLGLYRHIAPEGDLKMVLIRFFRLAPTHVQVVDEAASFLRPFLERLQATTASMQLEWTPWFKLDRLIQDSPIGPAAEVRDKVLRIEAELRPRSLILKPIGPAYAKRRADLETFGGTIRPMLRLPPEAGLDPRRATNAMPTRH
jgi:hypothetical protein